MDAKPGAAIAIDVDNLLISSFATATFLGGWNTFSLQTGFENLFAWVETFASISCVYLYVPMGQCLRNDDLFQKFWERFKDKTIFEMIYCPRRKTQDGRLEDDVDRHLISHSPKIVRLMQPDVRYFILGSGDIDYSTMLWQLKRAMDIQIALAVGSEKSLSGAYRQMNNLIGKHPVTGEELVHLFVPHKKQTTA